MTIRSMLAAKYDARIVQQHLDATGFLWMQPKIDGMRVLNVNTIPTSRSGKEYKQRHIRQWFQDMPSMAGFDGEVVAGLAYHADSFRDAMSGIRAEDGANEFTFYVFDHFHQPSWAYKDRLALVSDWLKHYDPEKCSHVFRQNGYAAQIEVCPTMRVTSLEEIDRFEAKFIRDGWEGAILRRDDRPYKFGRATALDGTLTKMKRFEDAEAIVVGYEPVYTNTNEATESPLGYTERSSHQEGLIPIERLGALQCQLLTDRSISFNIGVFRGLTHSDRDMLWENRDTLIGRIAKFKHQGYGGGYDKPRTPVWLGWRNPIDL